MTTASLAIILIVASLTAVTLIVVGVSVGVVVSIVQGW